MTDEQIKDIIVSLIEKGLVYCGSDNKETGQNIADLYIAINDGIENHYK